MKTTTITFKYHPTRTGKYETFAVEGCLVANNGSPQATRPQIQIHLPKGERREVDGAWVDYDGAEYHVIGTTVAQMDENTPTRWNRYAIAERIKAL